MSVVKCQIPQFLFLELQSSAVFMFFRVYLFSLDFSRLQTGCSDLFFPVLQPGGRLKADL